jgi:hypothetical protein
MAEFWSATKTLPKGVWIVKGKLDFHRKTTGGLQNTVFPRAKYKGILIASEGNSGENERGRVFILLQVFQASPGGGGFDD